MISAGKRWTVQLPIDQPAATLSCHPRIYPATAERVVKGLAVSFIESDGHDGRRLVSIQNARPH